MLHRTYLDIESLLDPHSLVTQRGHTLLSPRPRLLSVKNLSCHSGEDDHVCTVSELPQARHPDVSCPTQICAVFGHKNESAYPVVEIIPPSRHCPMAFHYQDNHLLVP